MVSLTHAAPSLAADPATTASITGTVTTGAGTPIRGARVKATGVTTASTSTDATGAFTIPVAPGVYSVSVEAGGFQPTTSTDIAVLAGASQTVTITLSATDLSSFRTIGRVSTSRSGGSTINTSASTTTFVPAQVFANLANPQINDVLQRIPDVTVQKMGSQQDTSIVIGGLQPYETQVLMDGHPLALGQYGVWLSHLFPTYLVGGIETQSGPGNTTPFANIAVAGTVNILTPGFTTTPHAEITTGIDNYSSQYTNILASGGYNKLQYVAAVGYAGDNGPYFKKHGCSVQEDYGTAANSAGSMGIIQFCGDESGSLYTKGELLKLRYNFSPSTSFEAGFVGSFGGYSPQGTAWGTSLGPTTIETCMTVDANICGNPQNANLVGQKINAIQWYPGTEVSNTQQIITAQFRTSLGDNTLLIRPYLGAIQPESYDGTQEGGFPSFFSAPGSETQVLPPGTPIPPGFMGNTPFEQNECPVGNIYSYSQINSPKNTIVSVDGQEECFQYPYTFYEKDKLYGTTFSFIHPYGQNFTELSYDFHGQSTFAYANAPSNVTVPLSSDRYSTISLTGAYQIAPKLGLQYGVYNTTWTIAGQKAEVDGSGNPILDGDGNPIITGLFRSINRTDPHLALTYRSDRDNSFRGSYGSSETFPFIGDVSGTAAYQPFAQSAPLYTLGIFTEKQPNLSPEFSQAYAIGWDHRFSGGGVVSLDLQNTTVHNVFQQLTLAENTTFNGQTGVLGIFTPINVATLRAQLAILKYAYAPALGVGYGASVAADRSILNGIPSGAYNDNPGFPVNGVQICGNGLFTPGLATCIPYFKGYAHIDYAGKGGFFASLGADYEGKNNAYYQPPFFLFDLSARKAITKNIELQFSIQNLANTNDPSFIPAPNAGFPVVAETASGLTNYTEADLIPAQPRTLRMQIKFHMDGH